MKVQIIKCSKIFQIRSAYNPKVLKLIKTIRNRYYCKKKKTWYLPIEDFVIFKESLANIPDIEINFSDNSQDGYHPHCKKHQQQQQLYNIDDDFINSSVPFSNLSNLDGLMDDENSIGLCAICGVKGSGYHYSVYSCEGCKAFFKRTVQNDLIYKCNLLQLCIINKETRNQCKFCRYTKCLRSGMKLKKVKKV